MKNYDVKPVSTGRMGNPQEWILEINGSKKLQRPTKKPLVTRAKEMAKREGGRVRIYKRDSSLQEKRDYSSKSSKSSGSKGGSYIDRKKKEFF
jgi:hypothetical protein